MVVGAAVISKASVHVRKLALLCWTAAVAVGQNTKKRPLHVTLASYIRMTAGLKMTRQRLMAFVTRMLICFLGRQPAKCHLSE